MQRTASGTEVRWHEFANAAAWEQSAVTRVLNAAERALFARGAFHIVLSGGETPRAVYRALRKQRAGWVQWHVYFGDERCLPRNNERRNSRMAAEALLDHVPIPADHVHPIPAELGPARGAAAYATLLQDLGSFDLVLLGLGADGHTASLFPGHDWGAERGAPDVLAITDAPVPPQQRISLSAARLSFAREVLFLVRGPDKREALARWLTGENLPARTIQPESGVDVLIATQDI